MSTFYFTCAFCREISYGTEPAEKCSKCGGTAHDSHITHARALNWQACFKKESAPPFHHPTAPLATKVPKIATLRAYLLLKVEECDWRSVMKTADDLRVLEGQA